jgi:hypothetical protein
LPQKNREWKKMVKYLTWREAPSLVPFDHFLNLELLGGIDQSKKRQFFVKTMKRGEQRREIYM